MLTMAPFSRLVRFLAKDGQVYYGDAILSQGTNAARATRARVIDGDVLGMHHVTDRVVDIRTLLSPLAPSHVGTVRCLGLNYADHAKETGMPKPRFPVLFYKPATALSGPADLIPVHPMAQEGSGLDYECELVVVMGKQCKDVVEGKALEYVLGYAVGNDVSHRDWQIKHGGGQWSHGKSFDGWAPWGPAIVSRHVIKDPHILNIWTKVNDKKVQNGTTAHMIFNVRKTIAFLSRGVTLMPGDLIFTGTPAGVGMGRTPQSWLNHCDTVEVGIQNIGSCTNIVKFLKPKSKADRKKRAKERADQREASHSVGAHSPAPAKAATVAA